jgi:carbon monoxide dehydrogenase subunit G
MENVMIEGTYTLQTSPEGAWRCLMDEQMLRQAIPGLDHLERLDEQTLAITVHIRQAPLIGAYHGHITVTDQQYPYYYSLAVEGEGGQSKIHGSGVVHLHARGTYTIVVYKGSLHLGMPGTLLPPLVVKGAAKHFIQQFFATLTEEIRAMAFPSSEAPETLTDLARTMDYTHERSNVITLPREQITVKEARKGYPYPLIHLLRLGKGDPQQEEEWATRIKRTGVVALLLLLVWVGTRLPKR